MSNCSEKALKQLWTALKLLLKYQKLLLNCSVTARNWHSHCSEVALSWNSSALIDWNWNYSVTARDPHSNCSEFALSSNANAPNETSRKLLASWPWVALELLWNCSGTALELLWNCSVNRAKLHSLKCAKQRRGQRIETYASDQLTSVIK